MRAEGPRVIEVDESEQITVALKADDLLGGSIGELSIQYTTSN